MFSRAAAFIMSGELAIRYFISHAPNSFFPILNRGDAAILYCFIFLYFAYAGGGPWSWTRSWRDSAFAWAHLKLAGMALWPIGKMIVLADDAPLQYSPRR